MRQISVCEIMLIYSICDQINMKRRLIMKRQDNNTDQLIAQLQNLKEKIKIYNNEKFMTKMKEGGEEWARSYNYSYVATHNRRCEMSIKREIGLSPRGKWLPFYKKRLARYQKKFDELEKSKYQFMEELPQDEIDRNVEKAKQELETQKLREKAALENLQNDTTLFDSLKKVEIVDSLIQYLQEGRVYNLTDAINLYYKEKKEDEHNEFIKKEVQKSTQATQQAAQAAQQAAKQTLEQMNHITKQLNNLNSKIYDLEHESDKTDTSVRSAINSLKSELNDISFDIRRLNK